MAQIEHLWLALLWALYLGTHSLLASNPAKEALTRVMGKGFRWYRLIYSIVASLGLAAVGLYSATLPAALLWPFQPVARWAGMLAATGGVIILRQTFRHYSTSQFLGLRGTTDDDNNTLHRAGILNHLRHPIYAGTILLVIGYFLFAPTFTNLVTALCIFIYLPLGIYWEEKKLLARFGDDYRKYKQEVPAIFPKINPMKSIK